MILSTSYFPKITFTLYFALLGVALNICGAQSAEFNQLFTAFQEDVQREYEWRNLNVRQPEVGDIENTAYEWKKEYDLKSLEKSKNNLGRNSYQKLYFAMYGYGTYLDRQYALKYWMENFIEGERIRRREMRSYDDAKPTLVIIRATEIIILTYPCKDYDYRSFDDWADKLYKYFKSDDSVMLEVACDGPLKWTRNAPDPRGREMF